MVSRDGVIGPKKLISRPAHFFVGVLVFLVYGDGVIGPK